MQSSGDEADQQEDSYSAGNQFVTRRLTQERLLDGQDSGPTSTEEAIQADPLLTDDQRASLLSVYRSYVTR